ncbi:MAG: type II toxin-antitoxin system HicA family toxin [Anaerolineales bacterium]|nr:type II toxin-antitoxin system HicA family toxin [Anaerolineales bacterium]
MTSRFEKAIQRLRQNPKNVKFEEIENILLRLGFEKRHASGSHATFRKSGYRPLTVPYKKPFVKPSYVKLLLKTLEYMGILDEE